MPFFVYTSRSVVAKEMMVTLLSALLLCLGDVLDVAQMSHDRHLYISDSSVVKKKGDSPAACKDNSSSDVCIPTKPPTITVLICVRHDTSIQRHKQTPILPGVSVDMTRSKKSVTAS